MNVTLFGKWVFTEVIKDIKMILSWIFRWAINLMTSILIRNRSAEADNKEKPHEDTGREWSHVSTSQGMPRV